MPPVIIPPTTAVLDDSGLNSATLAASENSVALVDDGVNVSVLVDSGENGYEISTYP